MHLGLGQLNQAPCLIHIGTLTDPSTEKKTKFLHKDPEPIVLSSHSTSLPKQRASYADKFSVLTKKKTKIKTILTRAVINFSDSNLIIFEEVSFSTYPRYSFSPQRSCLMKSCFFCALRLMNTFIVASSRKLFQHLFLCIHFIF